MCRFVVYRGRELFMSDLITESDRSLILQSFKAREREEPLNGDGFGVGWYDVEVDPAPCVFTSVRPAWSNRNLHRLAAKIRSTCFFAHIRAASRGSQVTEINCHPFEHDRFLFMHNGAVGGFAKIRRRLRESLSDEFYDLVQGTTDTEHVFALFLDRLSPRLDDYSLDTLQEALIETIRQLEEWRGAVEARAPSYYNFAVTDGQSVLATRFVSDSNLRPQTLYLARGDCFENRDGICAMTPGSSLSRSCRHRLGTADRGRPVGERASEPSGHHHARAPRKGGSHRALSRSSSFERGEPVREGS